MKHPNSGRARWRSAACAVLMALGAAVPMASAATVDLLPTGCVIPSGSPNGVDCVRTSTLIAPRQLVVSPDGNDVYSLSTGVYGGAVTHLRPTASGALAVADCLGEISAGCAGVQQGMNWTTDLALSPDGKNAYVTSTDSWISTLERVGDGRLQPAGCLRTEPSASSVCTTVNAPGALISPSGVTVSPDGKSVYVTSSDNVLSVYDRSSDGTIAFRSCLSPTNATCSSAPYALSNPRSVVVSPDGADVYVSAPWRPALVHFKRSSGGDLTFADCIGNEATCTPTPGLFEIRAMVFAPDGKNLYAASGERAVLQLSRNATGALSLAKCLGNLTACEPNTSVGTPQALAISADGRSVYLADRDNAALRVLTRASDGSLAVSSCLTGTSLAGCAFAANLSGGTTGVAVAPSGTAVYTASDYDVVSSFGLQKPPICKVATAIAQAGATVTIPIECTDPNGQPITLKIGDPATKGRALMLDATSTSVSYTAGAGATGADAFTVVATDPSGGTATTDVVVSIAPAGGQGPDGADKSTAAGVRKKLLPVFARGRLVASRGRLMMRATLKCPRTALVGCSGAVAASRAVGSKRHAISNRQLVTIRAGRSIIVSLAIKPSDAQVLAREATPRASVVITRTTD